MVEKTKETRELNDALRRDHRGGTLVVTRGIQTLGPEAVRAIVRAVSAYNEFHNVNDPYGEHDFGSLEWKGASVFFKIDYYDQELRSHPPDPADPPVTRRVMTIMLADEY